MIFSDNSLYGWGVGSVAMPRIALALHPARSRRTGEFAYYNDRGAGVLRWHSFRISRIFLEDYPWGHIISLGAICSFILLYFYLLHQMLPEDQNERLPKPRPVEILVALQESKPRPTTPVVEQESPASVAPDQAKKEVVIEPIREKPEKEVTEQPREIKPNVPVKISRISPKPKLPRIKVKKRVVHKKMQAPPAIASVAPDIEKPSKTEKITIAPPMIQKRNYMKNDAENISQADQASPLAVFKSAVKKNSSALDTIALDPTTRRKYYALQRDQKLKASQLKKTSNVPVLHQPDETNALTRPKIQFAAPRHISKTNPLQVREQTTAPVTNPPVSFRSQKWQQDSKLTSPVSIPLHTKTNQTVPKNPNSGSSAHNFSAAVNPDNIDPSDLISLQEFSVCKDPEKEFHQKTQLATHLLGPARIEAESVIFFIKYTESGYTIEIHVYNPYGHPFKDRCEVLELALKGKIHRDQ